MRTTIFAVAALAAAPAVAFPPHHDYLGRWCGDAGNLHMTALPAVEAQPLRLFLSNGDMICGGPYEELDGEAFHISGQCSVKIPGLSSPEGIPALSGLRVAMDFAGTITAENPDRLILIASSTDTPNATVSAVYNACD